jgi:pimeloyl-ACP methyl ester carboxylesterase
MPITHAGDIDIEYYIEGSGPPLLMLMGFAGQASSWGHPFVSALNQHFTTIRLSNRGTGLSTKPQDQFTIRTMADDARNLLDVLGIGRPHVLGISMGGMTAQEFVLAYPERVNGLVLGCTASGGPGHAAASPETLQALLPAPNLSREDLVRKAWPALVSPAFIENGRPFLEEMLKSGLENATPLETLAKQMFAINTFDASGRLSAVKAPTLVMHGDIDLLVPTPNGIALAEKVPGAQLHIIPGVAHMFFWEKPAESASAIVEFLAKVPAAA